MKDFRNVKTLKHGTYYDDCKPISGQSSVSVNPFSNVSRSWREETLAYATLQSIDLHSKSVDWFLYDRDLCRDRVNK